MNKSNMISNRSTFPMNQIERLHYKEFSMDDDDQVEDLHLKRKV